MKFPAIVLSAILVCGTGAFAMAQSDSSTAKTDMKSAGHDTADAGKDVGKGVAHGAKATGHVVKKGATETGHGVKKGAVETGHGVKKGTEATGQGAKKVGHDIAHPDASTPPPAQ